MNSFNVGDKIEGLDEFGVWAKATIVGILDSENFRVSFDGFGSMWDRITSKENSRPETHDNLRRLQSGDKTFILNAGEVTVVQVDPIRGKLIVELEDGEKKEVRNHELCSPQVELGDGEKKAVRNHELCSPPVPIASTTSKLQGNEEKCKAKKRKIQVKEKDNEELVPATDLCQTEEGADKEGQTGTELNCLFVYFLREDGMWLRIGDVVSVEGVGLPFIIFRMFSLDGCITVKLVKIHNSGLREDFVITCSVSYVVDYVGEKVSLKGSVQEKVEQSAFVEFCNFMLSGVDSSVKVKTRKLVLGHAMRVGLQGGFGNLVV
ncbi:Hypothetical predicted protein [Paramuricea clavata]|uniref:Uncharacterized protein n=1 Tax=Paramuricea clavata TaxID=317549 RepID=A0A7D9JSM5_PARCT|nr:Hypothetical predicted protein [Paramuricea clavata]